MAKELLVKETLSPQMIKAGQKLIRKLDLKNSEVKSAFWLYLPDEFSWKLVISSPIITREGPKKFYKRILESNRASKVGERVISINDIKAASPLEPIVQIISSFISTDSNTISEMRCSRNTINGVFIEDCLIYRSSK